MKAKAIYISLFILVFAIGCNTTSQVKENYILQIGSNKVSIDGSEVELNAPVIEVNGSTYIPLKFFVDRFNAENLAYDAETEKITFSMVKIAKSELKKPTEKNQVVKKEETTQREPEPVKPVINREYKNALAKAESYSETMHMSKRGVYDQLISEFGEKFTKEAAQYAIDNVKADWKANALAKAKTYSETMNMSKSGIYDQLISEFGEKFTKEEAQYAIDNLYNN